MFFSIFYYLFLDFFVSTSRRFLTKSSFSKIFPLVLFLKLELIPKLTDAHLYLFMVQRYFSNQLRQFSTSSSLIITIKKSIIHWGVISKKTAFELLHTSGMSLVYKRKAKVSKRSLGAHQIGLF